MDSTLVGPRLKLNRAREHLNHLRLLVEPFIQGERDRITIEYDADTGCKVFWLDPRPTPAEWGPVVGDALYNCRSALDQFANRLVEARQKPDRRTAFPIIGSEIDFLCRSGPMISKMSPEARALVDAAQPYKRPKWPEYHAFAVLNRLGNEDKHRQLHLTVTSFEGSGWYGDLEIVGYHFGPVVDRTPILAVRVSSPDVDVPVMFFLDVAFAQERRWQMPVAIAKFFDEVIGLIDQLFAGAVSRGLISE